MANIKLKHYLKVHHKSYISHKIERTNFVKYLQNIRIAYAQISEAVKANATEENIKNIVIDFIKDTFYSERKDIQINAFNNIDYAIKKNDNIEVIMEFKKPSNKAEMITCDNMNKKALHEAIKYFYDEKHKGNYHIKNIVISDGISYFIFNPLQFQHKSLEKLCYDSIDGDLYLQKTGQIYKAISDVITRENIIFEFAWFDLTYLEKRIKDFDLNNVDINDKAIRTLLYVYKLFHPDFLLNEYSPKDSNQLNKKFYDELLYILGLEEIDAEGKKLIKPNQNSNGLINETIKQLEVQKDITGDKAINIAFELIITWLNRILFLKLFESQLVAFNDDKNFKFITSEKITDFDDLNDLFFSILGKKIEDRECKEKTKNIPYLNSSLFEIGKVERDNISITALNNNRKLALYKSSNLKHWSEYKNKTEEKILKYLLEFLDSYDFSSGANDGLITEENRDIINSAVLGLIFEKLNGYKDGSFYTPGFITEYMAKECIERSVVDKFNAAFDDLNAKNIQEIRNYIGNVYSFNDAKKYNDIINSLRICDPAVGSGHFLVSVLNHIIYLKSYLGILFDDEGNKISNNIEIFDDTLVVFNQNDVPYAYKRRDKTTHQVQKALFKEKRTIIENCLFAVDINPKSVYICQLRLWIELLKNTYYIDNTDNMEVLPNIDINIKPGNSLISKYTVKVKRTVGQEGSKEQRENIKLYKQLVFEYKRSGDKNTKKEINQKLQEIKSKLYSVIENDLIVETKEQKQIMQQIKKLENLKKKATTIEERIQIDAEIESIRKKNPNKYLVWGDSFDNPIYNGSMEWMIEFPEVLDENGKFQGFDVVIGNPPYGLLNKRQNRSTAIEVINEVFDYYKNSSIYKNSIYKMLNIYQLFLVRSFDLLKPNGYSMQIFPLAFLGDISLHKLRMNIFDNYNIQTIEAFPERDNANKRVFSEAKMSVCISLMQKKKKISLFDFRINSDKKIDIDNSPFKISSNDIKIIDPMYYTIPQLQQQEWEVVNKIFQNSIKLKDIAHCCTGEVDMTQDKKFITSLKSDLKLYKGAMLDRYLERQTISQGAIEFLSKTFIDIKPKRAEASRVTRIALQGITGINERIRIKATIIPSNTFCANSVNYIDFTNCSYNYKYILALLNSRLLNFIFKKFSTNSNVNGYEVDRLPIYNIQNHEQIESCVNEIFTLTNSEDYFANNMKQSKLQEISLKIDNIIYQLYDLTDDEIKIVEEGL